MAADPAVVGGVMTATLHPCTVALLRKSWAVPSGAGAVLATLAAWRSPST